MSNLEQNSEEPVILVADTSSLRASLALGRGIELLGLLGLSTDERRSTHLLGDLDWLLMRLGLTVHDLDLFGVVTGPGSFTGLRVGLASMKGFAHARKRPVIGMTSLEVVARAAGPSPCTCALINAYRGELFAQLFAVDSKCRVTALSDPVVAKIESVLDAVAQFQREHKKARVLFSGEGATLHDAAIAERALADGRQFQRANPLTGMRAGWILQSPPAFLAADALIYAHEKFMRGEMAAADKIAACYVRPSEAEIKLKLGLIGKLK